MNGLGVLDGESLGGLCSHTHAVDVNASCRNVNHVVAQVLNLLLNLFTGALADSDGRRPDADELLAQAEKWRPWRAYAAQHVWTGSQ